MQTFKPIASALSRGNYSSNDQLARRLIEASRQLDWPSARSLGAKIGEIDLGRRGWWLKRPEHGEALAALLQVPAIDLGLHAHEPVDAHAFSRFPELPPLKLRQERPCRLAAPWRLGTDFQGKPYGESWDDLALWFEPDSRAAQRPDRTVHWLHVPPGTGLNLLWEWLESRGRGEYLRVETLSECSRRFLEMRPFAVRVDREDAQDVHVLASRELDLPVLVVAPFPVPALPAAERAAAHTFATWEFFEADRLQRRSMALTNPDDRSEGIQRYEWRLLTDWQDTLLLWVERRIGAATNETLLSASGVRRWMSGFSTEFDALRPADLMAICHLCHSIPERSLPPAGAPDAGTRLLRHLTGLNPHRANQFSRLVRASLTDRRSPWRSQLPGDTWLQFLGASGAAPADAEAVNAIADAPSKAARRQLAAEVLAAAESRSLAGLQANRLLMEMEADQYALQPAFLADLVARDQILQLVSSAEIDRWAALCFDASRRRLVDAALRVTPFKTLLQVQEQVLSMAPGNPLAIAAAEALFFAVGNLAARGVPVPRSLHSIAGRVLPSLQRDDFSGPSFWTRPAETRDQACEHLSVMWIWSLMADPPLAAVPPHWGWHFPAWPGDRSDPPVFDLLFMAADPFGARTHAPLLDVAERVVTSLKGGTDAPPAFLAPLLLARAVREDRPAPSEWLEAVVGKSEVEDFFLQRVAGQPAPGWLLPVYLSAAARSQGDVGAWRFLYSPIRQWVLRSISAEEADRVLDEQHRHLLWSTPSMLPPHLRSWLLLRAEPRKQDTAVRATIALIGAGEVEALERWLADAWFGPQAAKRMWSVAPSIAAAHMSRQDAADEAQVHLLMAAPSDHLASVVRLLREKPNLLDSSQLALWAVETASRAGPLAEDVLGLATGWCES
ncbi:hypothetical protein ACPWT1_02780 [Ramlibacter sp. MMS24-I3-19]|uniref:hypothetical protein n=1 Tax=Ramlibacter sp. MMS24-I3-19 TaxID=3416606 RepID=UPI003CFCCEFE